MPALISCGWPSGALQGGSEKLGDEDLEMVLDKLVRLLAYISGKPGLGCNVMGQCQAVRLLAYISGKPGMRSAALFACG